MAQNAVPPPIRWPADAVDSTGTDLATPLQRLLLELNLLESQPDVALNRKASTPWSLQVITAGSLQLTKVTSGLIGTLGGAGAIWAAVKGFAISQHDPDRLAYIAAAAAIVSLVAIAIAIIVRSDVMARAHATAAEYDARARSAAAFLETARPAPQRPPRYIIRQRNNNNWQVVEAFLADANQGLVAQVSGGATVPPANIEAITSVPEWI